MIEVYKRRKTCIKEGKIVIYTSYLSDEQITPCYLCHDAACSRACPRGMDPAGIIRSLRLKNEVGAALRLPDEDVCLNCGAPCEKGCVKREAPVQIKAIMAGLRREKAEMEALPEGEADLSTVFCGVRLENPFLLSSSVVASSYEKMARAFDMGWAGACFKTICSFIPAEASPRYSAFSQNGQFAGFKNIEQLSANDLEQDLEIIRRLKADYPHKVIIGSIMGRSPDEWEQIARAVCEAGADIVECNFSCPNMEEDDLGVTIGQSIEAVVSCTKAARRGCSVPLLAKLTPNVTDMVPFAQAAMEAGADGIAAINTVKSIVGMNLDTYATQPSVRGKSGIGGYSGKAVKPIALRFIWELASSNVNLPISGMGGVYTWQDAAEFLILGANHLQITTAVMEYGCRIIDDLKEGLSLYLKEKAFSSVAELSGIGVGNVVDLDDLERGSILYPRFNRAKCMSCGRCFLSCRDGGHEAIEMRENKPVMNPKLCVGCHLCVLVCPARAISAGRKRVGGE